MMILELFRFFFLFWWGEGAGDAHGKVTKTNIHNLKLPLKIKK
jgi:hypothetical protein